MKVVQFNIPSYELLSNIGISELTESNSEYVSEITNALTALRMREQGVLLNNDLEPIANGFEMINTDLEGDVAQYASGTKDFPVLGNYRNYSYPTFIRVKLEDKSIENIDFNEYIMNVLPNEWFGSWKQQSLVAGALAIKMVGWYKTLRPTSIAGGYDVTTITQKYIANTATTTTNNAVGIVYEIGMANSEGNLFYPEYAAGVSGQAGPAGGGQMKQWGSQYLAQQGYDYAYILNYYYKGSVFSDDNLEFFSIY